MLYGCENQQTVESLVSREVSQPDGFLVLGITCFQGNISAFWFSCSARFLIIT